MNRRSFRAAALSVVLLLSACDDSPTTSDGVSERFGPEGGRIELRGVAAFEFPAGFFPDRRTVSLATTEDSASTTAFEEFEGLFRASPPMSYQVRLLAGNTAPADGSFAAEIILPGDFVVPEGESPELFARVYEDAGEEILDNFQLLSARYDEETHSLHAELPYWVFTTKRRSDGKAEAVFMVAPTPGPGSRLGPATGRSSRGSRGLALDGDPTACRGVTLGRPVDSSFGTSSGYGTRKDPITGAPGSFHWGTDFKVPNGTPVRSMADGTIEKINTNRTSDAGLYIVVRHSNGSASDYMHLNSIDVAVGATVRRGQVIGLSDNSGRRSTGPHLHVEYVNNGKILLDKGRIDPSACMQESPNSSITVRDNGSATDDAFAVYLDGEHLGTTEVGRANTFTANNLIPGPHTLRVDGVVVPDNQGTWEVILNQGVTFSDGSTRKSGVMPTGGSVSLSINVPTVPAPGVSTRAQMRPSVHVEESPRSHDRGRPD